MAESKVKSENYREKYKRHFNIEFGDEYVVHHIDEDRSNNEIENLVLLPSILHSLYHCQKQIVEGKPFPTKICGNAITEELYHLACVENFINTLKECNKWFDYKMYLEGKIPNIHGINLWGVNNG